MCVSTTATRWESMPCPRRPTCSQPLLPLPPGYYPATARDAAAAHLRFLSHPRSRYVFSFPLLSHLAGVGGQAADERVTVGAAGGALVIVLDDDRLLTGVAALEDHHDLVGLKGEEEERGREPSVFYSRQKKDFGDGGKSPKTRTPRECWKRNVSSPHHPFRRAITPGRKT